jgi:hypothetical protein
MDGLLPVFDLVLFPLSLSAGRELPDLPGLLAATSPRRADRHRAGDMLILLVSAPASQTLPESFASEALQILSNAYYAAGGTLTSAVRTAVEQLNESLLSRRLSAAEGGSNLILLNLAVVHNKQVYIAHAGPVHSFVLSRSAVFDFSDSVGAGRGLGSSRSVSLRFFQAEIEPGDLLLFTPEPSPAWTLAGLAGSPQISLDALHRRLLNQAPIHLKAGMVQLLEGKDQVRRGQFPAAGTARPPAAPLTPVSESETLQPPALPGSGRAEDPQAFQPAPPTPEKAAAVPPASSKEIPASRSGRERRTVLSQARVPRPARPGFFARFFQKRPASAPAAPRANASADRDAAAPSRPAPTGLSILKPLAAFFKAVRSLREKTALRLSSFVPRLMPGSAGQTFSLSPLTMVFCAVAVPVVVVAIATTVYLRSGASEQRLAYIQQALSYADQAGKQKDQALRRSSWSQVVYWVKKADEFGSDDQSQSLRQKAQIALDSMDGIVRLSLSPAFTGALSSQIHITRIAATANDLFLLDSSQGRVLHMTLAGRSFEFDPAFSCGPGPTEGKIIGPLVGMAALPPNNEFKAAVIGIDAAGNLLYCLPTGLPETATLSPPDNNWGKIAGMTLQDGNLYVLDIQNNAVWRFDGANHAFTGRPRLFFGNEVPDLSDIVDLTVYQDDLYLLRSSGKMTVCTYSNFDFSPTRCNDPSLYGSRSGPVQNFSDASFLQMQTTNPPDPSLFILDTKNPAIYHFSLRLNYQRQLRQDPESDFPLPQKQVTAFAIAPTRVIFLAFNNEIYFGAMP